MMRWMMGLMVVALGLVGCEPVGTDLLAGEAWSYSIDAGQTASAEPPMSRRRTVQAPRQPIGRGRPESRWA